MQVPVPSVRYVRKCTLLYSTNKYLVISIDSVYKAMKIIFFPSHLDCLYSGGFLYIFFYSYMSIFSPQTVISFTPMFILQKFFSYYFTC